MRKRFGIKAEKAWILPEDTMKEYGKPMLEERISRVWDQVAAGLVGEGSECLGYDDVTSVDHDFGPGFCLWLTREDYEAVGQALQRAYTELPGEYMGFPARNVTAQGGDRVGVLCMDEFFRRYTGYERGHRTERNTKRTCALDVDSDTCT